jgi:YD repeat-containing protein
LADGKPIVVLCKQVAQATLDANGSQGFSAVIDAATPVVTDQYSYDATGHVLTATDARNQTTLYAYYTSTAFTGVDPDSIGHTVGDLQSLTNAAGQVTQFTLYDKAGRVRQSVDAKGVVTDTSYTPRGWINTVTVTPPGLAARTTTYNYDGVGQLTGVSNPDGSSLSFSYDAAHRLIGATDARGNSVSYTLDNMGNRVSEEIKDPGGVLQRSIARSFDALNRLQQITGAAR